MASFTKLGSLIVLCELMQLVEDFDLVFDGVSTWEGDEVSVRLEGFDLLLVGEDETEVIEGLTEPISGVMLNDCLALVQHDSFTVLGVAKALDQYTVNDPAMYEKPLL